MQRKSSIPAISDINYEGMFYWDILYFVQMDIENYNYIDIMFKDYHDGLLTEEVRQQ